MTEVERSKRIELRVIRDALLRVIGDRQTPPAVVMQAMERLDAIDAKLEAGR